MSRDHSDHCNWRVIMVPNLFVMRMNGDICAQNGDDLPVLWLSCNCCSSHAGEQEEESRTCCPFQLHEKISTIISKNIPRLDLKTSANKPSRSQSTSMHCLLWPWLVLDFTCGHCNASASPLLGIQTWVISKKKFICQSFSFVNLQKLIHAMLNEQWSFPVFIGPMCRRGVGARWTWYIDLRPVEGRPPDPILRLAPAHLSSIVDILKPRRSLMNIVKASTVVLWTLWRLAVVLWTLWKAQSTQKSKINSASEHTLYFLPFPPTK